MATSLQRMVSRLTVPKSNITASALTVRHCYGNSKSENSDASLQRRYYKYFLPMQIRISDTDLYGHVNNIIYYSYFDAIINQYLIKHCGLNMNLKTSDTVGYMVHTECTFKKPLSYPDVALAGLVISRIGRSSVKYSVAVFAQRADTDNELPTCTGHFDSALFGSFEETASAVGSCTHAFVSTRTNRPVQLPDKMHQGLQRILVNKKSKL